MNNYIILTVFKFSNYPVASPRNLTHQETFAEEFSDIVSSRERTNLSSFSSTIYFISHFYPIKRNNLRSRPREKIQKRKRSEIKKETRQTRESKIRQ